MKVLIAIASVLLIGTVVSAENVCYKAAEGVCDANPKTKKNFANCNSQFGAIAHIEPSLQNYANQQLAASYDYLLLGTFFNSYQKDRPGFMKLFRSLSDTAFENSIKLIKHVAKRGGVTDFKLHQEVPDLLNAPAAPTKILDFEELPALAKALDMEKQLSKKAIEVHAHTSIHSADRKTYDPEITQFLEEELLGEQASTIRKLSGYANDLYKIVNNPYSEGSSTPLGVYLFDEYLQKQ